MSQSPITTSPTNSTETPIASPIIDATPITTIHPSFASALNPKPKKTTAKRPSKFKTPKSKKTKGSSSSVSKKTSKKKGSNSKSKSIHTMQELYLDDVAEKDVESYVEASDNLASDLIAEKEKGNPNVVAETLEIQKGVTGDNATLSDTVGEGIVQDSPDVEETVTDQVVKEALNSLKDTIPNPNVALDVTTSLAQDEPTPDIVGNAGNTEEQVDKEPATDENVVPQTGKEPVADEEEDTDTPSTDNAVSVDDDVVDVDAMNDL
ncbi:hypothetical protein QL285_008289 [Trifolium repens]|nr:hypothetical protein QL285_008289 [Trifolium repens]